MPTLLPEIEAACRAGFLDQQHLELIEGELIDKSGKMRPHVSTVSQTVEALIAIFGAGVVNLEAPIEVAPVDNPTNQPEPDIIVLNRHTRQFGKSASGRFTPGC